MLCCISVGISQYSLSNLCPIPCAIKDAQNVFNSFYRIMGEEFNNYASVCATDIRSDEFESLVKALNAIASTYDDLTVVMYFSGHAQSNGTDLELRFADYNEMRGGHFNFSTLRDKFLHAKNILYILDCCHAGEGLVLASNLYDKSRVSVLTACGLSAAAEFDDEGSKFTKILCEAIDEIYCNEESFTINTLIGKINDLGYTSSRVHIGTGETADLVLKPCSAINNIYDHFPNSFISKIRTGNILVREALWYSVDCMPHSIIAEICSAYFQHFPVEASWLVRRAIGSTLANHLSNRSIELIVLDLLDSDYWQNQCIAIIALRYVLKERKDISDRLLHNISTHKIIRIDAVWLANLYLADSPYYSVDVFRNTQLYESSWGVLEIFKAQMNNTFDDYKTVLRDFSDCSFYKVLEKECEFNFESRTNSRLMSYLYQAKSRGCIPHGIKSKFLFSALYGNWRNQISLSLKTYFETTQSKTIEKELMEIEEIPNIERKMGLYAYLTENLDIGQKYEGCVRWGMCDEHPWVRRTALEFYLKLQYGEELKPAFFDFDFKEKYPGVLDFYLICPISWRGELTAHLENKFATVADRISFRDAMYLQ